MKNYVRHVWIYKLLMAVLSPLFKWRMRYQCVRAGALQAPYVVLANHNTDWDPMLVALSFPQHMYFVASEHIYRWGFISRLLFWCFAPIARAKGSTDARTVMEILSRIHAGYNVCVFAEGNRSFNGLTTEILPATGKLIKASGATLVTYKIQGGYLTSPRWSKTIRRGKMLGYPVGTYTAEQLRQMTPEEVNDVIRKDLSEDAYARQRENPVRYRGKRLAEYLETVLYLCPSCEKIGTLRSDDDRFFCDCGLEGRYSEYGELQGNAIPFKSITEWDIWQSEKLHTKCNNISDTYICTDVKQKLYRVQAASGRTLLTHDSLFMYRDRLVCGEYSFSISRISNMAIYGMMSMIFTTVDGGYYEIISDHPRSATKYLVLYQTLKHNSAS